MAADPDFKRPGRPPVAPGDVSVRVTVTLPARAFDDLCRQSMRDRITLSETIRRKLDADEHPE